MVVVPFSAVANIVGTQLFFQFRQARGFPHLSKVDADRIGGVGAFCLLYEGFNMSKRRFAFRLITFPDGKQMRCERRSRFDKGHGCWGTVGKHKAPNVFK